MLSRLSEMHCSEGALPGLVSQGADLSSYRGALADQGETLSNENGGGTQGSRAKNSRSGVY